MPRRLFALAVVLVAAWIAVQAQNPPGSPSRPSINPSLPLAPQNQPGVIIGQIVEASTGRGVPRAIVRIAGRGIGVTRVADDRGRYYFVAVPEGDVEITATKPGYFDGAFGKRRAGGIGVPLTMTPGRWVTDAQIELFKGAAISGVVSDESGEGLAGTRVRAWRRDYAEGREQLVPAADVLTDDDGGYRLFGLQPGAYIISVPSVQVTLPLDTLNEASTKGVTPELLALLSLNRATAAEDRLVQPGGKYVLALGGSPTPPPSNGNGTFAYQTEFFPGFDSPVSALPIEVSSGDDRNAVNFQLRLVQTHRVSGVVAGPNGPVARQLVRLVLDGADDYGFGSEAATTVSDADGAFTLLNVPEGKYSLQVRTLGGVLSAASPGVSLPDADSVLAAPAMKAWGEVPVSIDSRDVTDVIIRVRPCLKISGQVMLEGSNRGASPVEASAIRISVLPADRTIGAALTRPLTKDGTFEFSDLPPGSYFVRVNGLPRGWSLKAIESGGRDLLEHPVDLDDDADVTVALTDRSAELWGSVRDARRAQVPGATVIVMPVGGVNPNRTFETRAATSSVFSIAGLPAGDYYVIAIDDAQAEGWQDRGRVEALRALATRVSVRNGERRLIDLQLQIVGRK